MGRNGIIMTKEKLLKSKIKAFLRGDEALEKFLRSGQVEELLAVVQSGNGMKIIYIPAEIPEVEKSAVAAVKTEELIEQPKKLEKPTRRY